MTDIGTASILDIGNAKLVKIAKISSDRKR